MIFEFECATVLFTCEPPIRNSDLEISGDFEFHIRIGTY